MKKLLANIVLGAIRLFSILAISSLASSASEEWADCGTAILRSGDLSVRINPERAFTINTVWLDDNLAGNKYGNWGLVYHPGQYKWVGSGHHEGGQEAVEEIVLLVDGQEVPWPQRDDSVFNGKRLEVIKHSLLHEVKLTSRIIVQGDSLEEEATLNFDRDTYIHTGYPFMHCWTSKANYWMGKTTKGALIEGDLVGDNAWKIKEDFQWLALYSEPDQLLILMEFPPDLPKGKQIRTAIHDHTSFRKQYYQAYSVETVPAGEEDRFRMATRFFRISLAEWRQKAISEAHEYEGETDQGDAGANTGSKQAASRRAGPVEQAYQDRFQPIPAGQKPDWLANPVAMAALNPDTVLQPWTPIQIEGDTVSVWGRDYQLGAWGLPRSISALGEELLAGPIKLNIRVDRDEVSETLPRLEEQHAGRVRYESELTGVGLNVDVSTTIEYDGFIRYDLRLEAEHPVNIKELSLVIPLKPEQAQFLQHASAWRLGMSQQNTAKAFALSQGQGDIYQYGFTPFLWIGGYDRGLCWAAESDQFWFPAKSDHAIKIKREGDRVDLIFQFVNGDVSVDGVMSFSFVLMATPVKPLPDGWRAWHFSSQNPSTRPSEAFDKIGNHIIYWYDKWRIVHHYPVPKDMKTFRNDVSALKLVPGAERVYSYLDVTLMSKGDFAKVDGEEFFFTPPEWPASGKDWVIEPNFDSKSYIRVTPASSWADFALYNVKDWIVEGGITGVYLDESFPYADTRADHGMGYTNKQGLREPTYPIFATRDFYKRLAYLFQKYGDGPPALLAHTSATSAMPYLSFADIHLSGEEIYHDMRKWAGPEKPNYIEMASDDRFHAEMRAVQFGLVPALFAPIKGSPLKRWPELKGEETTTELLTQAELHDTLVWPVFMDAGEVMHVIEARLDFNIGASDVTFHPYWETPKGEKILQGNGKLSYYLAPGRALAVVANQSNVDESLSLHMDAISGQSRADLSVIDALNPNDIIAIVDGWAELAVPARSFKLIRADW